MSLNEKMIQIPAKNITNIFGEFDVHIKKIERTLGVTVIAREDGTVFLQNNQSIDKNVLIVLETESGFKLLVKEEE